MRQHQHPACGRGVWTLPFLSASGNRMIAAVGSDNKLASLLAVSDSHYEDVRRAMWGLLDEADPIAPVPIVRVI